MGSEHIYEVELTDGRKISAEIQGSGGIIRSTQRLSWVMAERVLEARDKAALAELAPLVEGQMMTSHGASMLAKHAGNLSLWTDPENPDCSKRLTTVPIGDVYVIRQGGKVLWGWEGPVSESMAALGLGVYEYGLWV